MKIDGSAQAEDTHIVENVNTVILVDPIGTGEPFRLGARDMGLSILSVMTVPTALSSRMRSEAPTSHDADVVDASTIEHVMRTVHRRKLKVKAVVPATEPGVDLAEALSSHLGLTGNTSWPGARRDKAKMRERLHAAGLASPHFARAVSRADIRQFITQHGLPLVLKTPAGAGGSQVKVFICRNAETALSQFDSGIGTPDIFGQVPEFLLVEEFISGPEFAANVFVHDGRMLPLGSQSALRMRNSR